MYIQVTTPACHASAIMIVGFTATVARTMNNFATTAVEVASGRLLFLQLVDVLFSLIGETRGRRGRQSSSIARQIQLNNMQNAYSDRFYFFFQTSDLFVYPIQYASGDDDDR